MGKYGKGIFAEQRSSNAEGEFKEQKTEMPSERKQCMQIQLFSSKSKIKNPLATKQSQKIAVCVSKVFNRCDYPRGHI